MTACDGPVIPRELLDMAQKVWQAQTNDNRHQAVTRGTSRPAGYYGHVWTLFIGSRAYALLRTVPDPQQVVVGRHFFGGTERQRGRLDRWEVLGVPVTEDTNGPLDLWRLADGDGTTICWGELTP